MKLDFELLDDGLDPLDPSGGMLGRELLEIVLDVPG